MSVEYEYELDKRERDESGLARCYAQAGARQNGEKSNEHTALARLAKRDFRISPSDLDNIGEDPLGEPMTINEIARMLRCSIWTVRQRHLRAGLPHIRTGRTGKLLFYRKQVVNWILQNQLKGGIPL